MFDVLITGGTVVDGTGSPGYRADIAITGETITALGDLSEATAKRIIDASGLVVAPGFIDTHTHSEGDLLVNPQHGVRPAPRHHHRAAGHRRHVVRAALPRQLPHVSALAEGAPR